LDQSGIGKALIIIGLVILLAGILLTAFGKIPFLGKLPGDFSWKGRNWSFHFPFATSILLSIILSLIFYFIGKFK
jgi:hypothetical protein